MSASGKSSVIRQLSSIKEDYDALLLDLWGCVHDGSALYPHANECLRQLKEAGKRVVFLSNAPRRAERAQVVLDALGVDRVLYEAVVTSGEVGFSLLRAEGGASTYYFIGPERDADVLAGLPYRAVDRVEEAGFLLNCGFGTEAQSTEDFAELLHAAVQQKLPMLCLNPDMEVVKITGERYECAGVIAREYARLGGSVRYIGKPYPEVYEHAFSLLAGVPKTRILAVGDGLHTDILGARDAGLASVLIAGGILAEAMGGGEAAMREWISRQDVQPDWVMPELRW